jgi:hypothetical protein
LIRNKQNRQHWYLAVELQWHNYHGLNTPLSGGHRIQALSNNQGMLLIHLANHAGRVEGISWFLMKRTIVDWLNPGKDRDGIVKEILFLSFALHFHLQHRFLNDSMAPFQWQGSSTFFLEFQYFRRILECWHGVDNAFSSNYCA